MQGLAGGEPLDGGPPLGGRSWPLIRKSCEVHLRESMARKSARKAGRLLAPLLRTAGLLPMW